MRIVLVLTGVLLSSASFAQTPYCPYGLEPGMGPMRCADPRDPNSYLNRQPQRPRPVPQQTGPMVYDIEHPPPFANNRFWCRDNTRSATDLDRCSRRQHHEKMPEDYPALPPSAPSGPLLGQARCAEDGWKVSINTSLLSARRVSGAGSVVTMHRPKPGYSRPDVYALDD
jgi:hypothetical protein